MDRLPVATPAFVALLLGAVGLQGFLVQPASGRTCVSTRSTHQIESAQNPSYKPGAPIRWSVGKGHLLVGIVRSTECRPIAHAKLELFLAGPNGYSDGVTSWANRATVFTHGDGAYRFQSPFPTTYAGRPHIHMKVSAAGFRTLFVPYFPRRGESRGTFNIVLVPSAR